MTTSHQNAPIRHHATLRQRPALVAIAMAMAVGRAMAGGPGAVGMHPATSPRTDAAAVSQTAGIDPNTFIVGHPASPTRHGGHANGEHPAVIVARLAGRPSIDANTFIVQPPVTVTWRVEPDAEAATRWAQAPAMTDARLTP